MGDANEGDFVGDRARATAKFDLDRSVLSEAQVFDQVPVGVTAEGHLIAGVDLCSLAEETDIVLVTFDFDPGAHAGFEWRFRP